MIIAEERKSDDAKIIVLLTAAIACQFRPSSKRLNPILHVACRHRIAMEDTSTEWTRMQTFPESDGCIWKMIGSHW